MAVQQGQFVEVRGRPWLVEAVDDREPSLTTLRLSCIADDTQGEQIEVIWDAEIGAKVVAHALRDAGIEVVYSGLKRTPDELVAEAVQEDVDVIGLSVLSGAHLTLSGRLLERLREADAGDVAVVVGGTIPARDAAALRAMGVQAVFPMGTPLPEIVSFFRAFRRTDA